jgi:hypothetical protein
MMDFLFWLIGSILMCMMITHGFRLATRIAVASETAALSLAAIYNALPPEAKARSKEAIAAFAAEPRARPADPVHVMRPISDPRADAIRQRYGMRFWQ